MFTICDQSWLMDIQEVSDYHCSYVFICVKVDTLLMFTLYNYVPACVCTFCDK